MAASRTQNPMLETPVGRGLIALSAPVALGMISTFLFQVVDTYFVGQLGAQELAALSFAGAAYFFIVAVFMGAAVGVSALVGNAIGQSRLELARRFTSVAAIGAFIGASAISAVGFVTLGPLFRVLGAGPALIPMIRTYLEVLLVGLPFLVVALVGGASLRASGRARQPEVVMGVAGLINVVLDYLLIFGVGPFPELGLRGAAIATVGSWGFAVVVTMLLVARAKLLTSSLNGAWKLIHSILSISTPAIATQVLLPLTAMFITFLAARTGPEVVAAFGVAQRVETLALVGISAMSVAVVPFVAQNDGAQRSGRVARAIAFSRWSSFLWGGGACLILVGLAAPIARSFSSDAAIIEHTESYFFIVAASYGPYGVVVISAAVLNGVQASTAALRILLAKTLVLTVPLAAIGSFYGAKGIFASIALGNFLGAAYAVHVLRGRIRPSDPTTERGSPTVGLEEAPS